MAAFSFCNYLDAVYNDFLCKDHDINRSDANKDEHCGFYRGMLVDGVVVILLHTICGMVYQGFSRRHPNPNCPTCTIEIPALGFPVNVQSIFLNLSS